VSDGMKKIPVDANSTINNPKHLNPFINEQKQ
jgi:hypothetical protein